MSTGIRDILERLAQGKALSDAQADTFFGELMAGRITPAQGGAFLMGLRAKGEDSTDLAAGVRAALAHAKLVPGLSGPRIDTCGTGGDESGSFNCSTAVALFLASLGHKVVKHGNRAVSSTSGSADAIEALGLPLNTAPEDVAGVLARKNFVFLFAPAFHPSFAHIAPIRRELGIRTLFNLMGPLLNPARPTHQLVGVANPDFLMLMGETLLLTGVEKALVVHGAGDFDELTTFGPARAYIVRDGVMEKMAISPERLGFKAHAPENVRVSSKEEAVSVLKAVLAGKGPEAMMDMTALNLAAALYLLEDRPFMECAAKAREAVRQGVRPEILHA